MPAAAIAVVASFWLGLPACIPHSILLTKKEVLLLCDSDAATFMQVLSTPTSRAVLCQTNAMTSCVTCGSHHQSEHAAALHAGLIAPDSPIGCQHAATVEFSMEGRIRIAGHPCCAIYGQHAADVTYSHLGAMCSTSSRPHVQSVIPAAEHAASSSHKL